MAARVGFFATIGRQSRQARKGATVTVTSGAEEVPARVVSTSQVVGGVFCVMYIGRRSIRCI